MLLGKSQSRQSLITPNKVSSAAAVRHIFSIYLFHISTLPEEGENQLEDLNRANVDGETAMIPLTCAIWRDSQRH